MQVVYHVNDWEMFGFYWLASVYHAENIDKVAFDFIEECGIEKGNYCI